MKVIKGAIVLALFLGCSEAISVKSSSIESNWIPEEQTMLMLQKEPEYYDFEMKFLAKPKEDPNAPNAKDELELKLVGDQEKARKAIAQLEK